MSRLALSTNSTTAVCLPRWKKGRYCTNNRETSVSLISSSICVTSESSYRACLALLAVPCTETSLMCIGGGSLPPSIPCKPLHAQHKQVLGLAADGSRVSTRWFFRPMASASKRAS